MTDKEIIMNILSETHTESESYKEQAKLHDEYVANKLINNHVIVLPCDEGDTIYHIVKCCGTNTGYKEFYRPNKEFDKQCKFLDPQSWYDDSDSCKAAEDRDEGDYCNLYLKIFCDECKERLVWKRDKFTLSKRTNIYGTPMFDETTSIEDTYYLTQEDVEVAIERIKNGTNSNK